ncbi:unnamed protein product [Thlaspi arvense]|uniref:Uncharacterized protein n=1 Tax=Thlaspi arvense TaxID=13288 RepID=A0AAU9RU44_THLAR|nr:unnamed protein product [Thlaspi arvense]
MKRKSRSLSHRRHRNRSLTPRRDSSTPRRYKRPRSRSRSPSLSPDKRSPATTVGSAEPKRVEEEKKRRQREAEELKLIEEEL